MNWISVDNKEKRPQNKKTYWVSLNTFGVLSVEEARYVKGKWFQYRNDEIMGLLKIDVTSNVLGWYPVVKPDPMPLKEPIGLEFPEFKVNYNGNNKKIRIHVLDEDKMRSLGFTDYREGYWHISKTIPELSDITFNLSVNKKNPYDYRIDVLDENFCQPYDYQHMLTKNKNFAPALRCLKAVEEYMDWLTKEGIVSGHKRGEYV